MVRLIRFMSEEELDKFLSGKPLKNTTKFEQNGSKGFCFFKSDDIDPITAQHVLAGIATLDYMVEFFVEERTVEKMTKAEGKYHLPGDPLFEATNLPEYSTTEYNRQDFWPYQIWRLYMKMPVFGVRKEGGKTVISLNSEENGDEEKPKNRHAF